MAHQPGLDNVCFCHGTPRRDDEIITRLSSDAVLAEASPMWPSRSSSAGTPSADGPKRARDRDLRERRQRRDAVRGSGRRVLDDRRRRRARAARDAYDLEPRWRSSAPPASPTRRAVGASLVDPIDPVGVGVLRAGAGRAEDPGEPPPAGAGLAPRRRGGPRRGGLGPTRPSGAGCREAARSTLPAVIAASVAVGETGPTRSPPPRARRARSGQRTRRTSARRRSR